jgi:predicted AAA+ superfamily ATPase
MSTQQRYLFDTLKKRLAEKRKFIQVISGPRQVGKTTLSRQLADDALASGKAARFYSADDAPLLGRDWLDGVWENFRAELRVKNLKEGILFIDEIQKIDGWSEAVKKNWDSDSAARTGIKLVILGSSRLLLQEGLGESLVGRFEMNFLGHWSFAEMEAAFGWTLDEYIWFGGYPGAADLKDDERRFKSYIRDAIIEPSISRDIIMLTRVSKPALLRQLFDLGVSYSSQILGLNKIMGTMQDAGNTTTLSRYLELLEQAGLLSGLQKYNPKLVNIKASMPKFQVQNMALFSAQCNETFAEARMKTDFWGRAVESAVGAYLVNEARRDSRIKVYYWRDGDDEVDFVIKQGASRLLGIEVKSNPLASGWQGLALFGKKFPTAKTVLVGGQGIPLEDFFRTPLEEFLGDKAP